MKRRLNFVDVEIFISNLCSQILKDFYSFYFTKISEEEEEEEQNGQI